MPRKICRARQPAQLFDQEGDLFALNPSSLPLKQTGILSKSLAQMQPFQSQGRAQCLYFP